MKVKMKSTVEVDCFGMAAAVDHSSEASIANGERISPVLPTFFSKPNLQVRTSTRFRFHRSQPSTVTSTRVTDGVSKVERCV